MFKLSLITQGDFVSLPGTAIASIEAVHEGRDPGKLLCDREIARRDVESRRAEARHSAIARRWRHHGRRDTAGHADAQP
jgi:hypothetical protein